MLSARAGRVEPMFFPDKFIVLRRPCPCRPLRCWCIRGWEDERLDASHIVL